MEDSFEDYIKIMRNTKDVHNETKNEEVSKEVFVTLQRRKECETKAVKIVEFLIEGKLRPEVFLRCLKHINQSYYQDVVVERAISKLCGYSLCGKQIPKMPKKQFFINTKNNKIYDVTDRKNYCSNFCYRASIHIKQQIEDSPLWVRKLESCPKFNLLPSTERGIPGEEIDHGVVKPQQEPAFTSISSFTQISLAEMDETEVKDKQYSHKTRKNIAKKPEIMQTLNESEETSLGEVDFTTTSSNSINKSKIDNKITDTNEAISVINPQPSSSNVTIQNIQENNLDNIDLEKNKIKSSVCVKTVKLKKKCEVAAQVLENIRKYVHEWITLETYVFLYGESKVKEMLNEKQLQEYFETLKFTESKVAQQRKYLEICRKLHLSQLAEDKIDKTLIGTKLQPIPDYKELKAESKTMNLKVHSFYSGLPYEPNVLEKKEESNTSLEKPVTIVPLVDVNSQTAIRRKIYLNSINNVMLNLIQNLGIQPHSVMEDLRLLVKTFKLEAHNVVFKPAMWSLISLVLIKMLSIRDHSLKEQLEMKRSETFINTMLNSFPGAQVFLQELLQDIQDINLFLKQYFSENDDL